jgi:hypothetical protein
VHRDVGLDLVPVPVVIADLLARGADRQQATEPFTLARLAARSPISFSFSAGVRRRSTIASCSSVCALSMARFLTPNSRLEAEMNPPMIANQVDGEHRRIHAHEDGHRAQKLAAGEAPRASFCQGRLTGVRVR